MDSIIHGESDTMSWEKCRRRAAVEEGDSGDVFGDGGMPELYVMGRS